VGKSTDEPAQNIFIVVNFIDLIRTGEDRQQIALLFQELTKGKSPVVIDDNRIHFISAQKSVEAIVANNDSDEYLQGFRDFIQAVNNFLNQRGYLRIQQPCNKFKQIIREYSKELEKAENSIANDLQKIEDEINRITDQIGHAENCQKEILLEAERLVDMTSTEMIKNWNEWSNEESLKTLITRESVTWSSKYNPVFKQKEIIQDYVEQLNRDLKNQLEKWGEEEIAETIGPKSHAFEEFINEQLESIRLRIYGSLSKTKEIFNYQKYQTDAKLEDNFFGIMGIRGGVIIGSISAMALWISTQPHLGQLIAAGTVTTILSSLGLGTLDVDKLKPQIKDRVIDAGLQRFDRSKFEKDINKLIQSIFVERAKMVNKEIDKLIIQWKAELQKKQKDYETTKGGQKSDQIKEQQLELSGILKEVDSLLAEIDLQY
jgi:hypothetical protein